MKMIFFNNDTSMGQRKILSRQRESNHGQSTALDYVFTIIKRRPK